MVFNCVESIVCSEIPTNLVSFSFSLYVDLVDVDCVCCKYGSEELETSKLIMGLNFLSFDARVGSVICYSRFLLCFSCP